MRADIEAAFPICATNGCIVETTANEILIKDQGRCNIVNKPDDYHFTINNSTGKNVLFIAIDKCIWDDDSDHKKCDFSTTDSATFAFVEIKDTETHGSGHRKRAKAQLEATISRFIAVINFDGIAIKAIISWRYIPSKPAASTAMQSAALHFWNAYKAELLEGNQMSF